MDLFLQQLANGLIIGSTYAVVALGFALAFTVLRVINFAHPEIFMVGMFAGLVAGAQFPAGGFIGAVLLGAIGAAIVGFVLERRTRILFNHQDRDPHLVDLASK